jgi:ferritin-like protein
MASEMLHEPAEKLKPETIELHRAIVSLQEELEAFDWYHQRVDACTDARLRAILEHNMNEEAEHASMLLEWVRRHVPKFDVTFRRYLFAAGDITEIEEKGQTGNEPEAAQARQSKPGTTIGGMKGE